MADIDTKSDELILAAQVLATADAAQISAHIRQRFAERMTNRDIDPNSRPDILVAGIRDCRNW